jgi:hypothetical protein
VKLERIRPTAWQLTLHPLELAALISVARWAEDGAQGELPTEARAQLRSVLDSYDQAVGRS